ncbi:MAG: transcription antitermination factor NusB [Candidatus Nitrospinota bacterium M3_3B_026]
MSGRRRSREAAVKILYRVDLAGGGDIGEAMDDYFGAEPSGSPGRDFTESLVRGVIGRLGEIDSKISGLLERWTLDRLGYLERAILRMAVYEMYYEPATPDKVVIDEAVEIAKKYCEADSAGFVNGVLDRAMREKTASAP